MKTTRSRPKPRTDIISSELRAIVARSDSSVYRLEQEAGIPRGGLARFVSGETSLKLATVDRLAGILGLRLIEVERRVPARVASQPKRPVAKPSASTPPVLDVAERVDHSPDDSEPPGQNESTDNLPDPASWHPPVPGV